MGTAAGPPTINDNLIASEPEKAPVRSAVEPGHLQLILATGDGAVLAAAFALVMGVLTVSGSISAWALLYTVAAASIGLLSLRLQHMWSLHKIGVRSAELTGLLWTSVAALVGVAGIDRVVGSGLPRGSIAAAAGLAFVLLVMWRSVARSYVAISRRRGCFVEPTIVVGTDDRAMELVRIAEVHPEAGMRVVGIVGSRDEALAAGRVDLWLGEVCDLERIVRAVAVERIVVSDRDIAPATLSGLIRAGHEGGPEVVIHAGLPGIDATRVSVSASANETLLHVQPSGPSRLARDQAGVRHRRRRRSSCCRRPADGDCRRTCQAEDGGPILFRQQRVGRDDAEFGMFKFRTMCVDAEAKLAAMHTDNQRSGPSSRWPATRTSRRSAISCGAPAWTSCPSSSMSSRAT